MRTTIIALLIVGLSGMYPLGGIAFAALEETGPIIRHQPPSVLFEGEKIKIEAIVEEGISIDRIILWYRTPGSVIFQKTIMRHTEKNNYEAYLEATDNLKNGIEYYIEASDPLGNKGRDGSEAKPYFVEVREAPSTQHFALSTGKDMKTEKKPFWKRPWFWVSVVAIVGGGVAASSSGGDGTNTGTVVVE